MKATDFYKPITEFKFASSTGEISGYGATFGNVDLGGDACQAGCFMKSLAGHKDAGTMPAMLWSHDPAEPIGTWTSIDEDAKGLRVVGRLTLDTQRGAEARALARDGALALSIGYATRDADYAKGHRVLRELALYEVSLVAMPMNTQARITQVKSAALAASEIRDPVAFERFLKANGFANSTARRLAAGFNDAVGRSSDDEAIQQLAVLLKESAAFHKAN